MGDVVQFRKPGFAACPCGWCAPRNIQVEVHSEQLTDKLVGLAVICFDCPTCGTRLQMGQPEKRVSDRA
jgi:hypothetical protein